MPEEEPELEDAGVEVAAGDELLVLDEDELPHPAAANAITTSTRPGNRGPNFRLLINWTSIR
jgi:hypothetical protein